MYKLVMGMNTSELVKKVNESVREGYEPQGGLVILESGNLCQPMFYKRKY